MNFLKIWRSAKHKSAREIELHIVILLMAGFIAFLIKATIVYPIEYVGYCDAAAYAEMADSLSHGRGFEVDYVSWYFIKRSPEVARPEDHWPPLYPAMIAPFFLVLGKTAFAAKLPSLIISCFLLPLLIYFITKELSGSKVASVAAGLGVLFYPFVFEQSLRCLSDILYTSIICASVLFAMKSLDKERFLYPMAISMGLAYYAKGSGLMLIPGIILFHIVARRSIRKVLTNKRFLLAMLIVFLVLLPWLVRNYAHFGDPLFSTQRFVAGFMGYSDWEAKTRELYWGEKPPPSFFDKFKRTSLFNIRSDFRSDLDNGVISRELYEELKKRNLPLSGAASVSIMERGSKWLIRDSQIYTVEKEGGLLKIYSGGFHNTMEMMSRVFKGCFWMLFVDIGGSWGKLSSYAFLTFFVNIPALLGIFLLRGNKKRHAIWINAGLLGIFLCIGWIPTPRLVFPMTVLLMPLGWATIFHILKKLPVRSAKGSISSAKAEHGPDVVANFLVCCMVALVFMVSAVGIGSASRRGTYPYYDAAWDCIDVGAWLKENASSDAITMTTFPWDLHFYSEQPAIQIPRAGLAKTIEVMRYYKPQYILLESRLETRPSLASLMPLVTGEAPGLKLVYDNKELKLYSIAYDLLPK